MVRVGEVRLVADSVAVAVHQVVVEPLEDGEECLARY